jgi:hypothetical protein
MPSKPHPSAWRIRRYAMPFAISMFASFGLSGCGEPSAQKPDDSMKILVVKPAPEQVSSARIVVTKLAADQAAQP